MGVDVLWRVLCEGRKVSYVREPSQSQNMSTSVDERDSFPQAFFCRCLRENTYFYVFLVLPGEMVRCILGTYLFQDVLCARSLSCYVFFSVSNNCCDILSVLFILNFLGVVTHILVFWSKNKNRDNPVTSRADPVTIPWHSLNKWSQTNPASMKLDWSWIEAGLASLLV